MEVVDDDGLVELGALDELLDSDDDEEVEEPDEPFVLDVDDEELDELPLDFEDELLSEPEPPLRA